MRKRSNQNATRMDLSRVDLNLLVAFDVLLEERSVTRAAARLFVGQSAMSAKLSRLRELFDDPILIRQGRHFVVTPAAESLIEPVREALALIDATLTVRNSFDPKTAHRSFSVLASEYATLIFLRPLLATLSEEAPHVTLQVRHVSDDFAEQLRQNRTDLLIIPKEAFPEYEDFPHERLFSDRYVCATDAANPDIGRQISLAEFSRQPYLATSAGRLRSLAEMQLDKLGISRRTEITTSFALAFFLLRGTRLISLVHERLARMFAGESDLRLLEPPMPLEPITEVMVWMPRNADDPGHCWLRQRLRRLALELFDDDPGADADTVPGSTAPSVGKQKKKSVSRRNHK